MTAPHTTLQVITNSTLYSIARPASESKIFRQRTTTQHNSRSHVFFHPTGLEMIRIEFDNEITSKVILKPIYTHFSATLKIHSLCWLLSCLSAVHEENDEIFQPRHGLWDTTLSAGRTATSRTVMRSWEEPAKNELQSWLRLRSDC